VPNVRRIITLTFLAILPVTLFAQESTDFERLFNRGDEYLQAKNYSESIKELEKAISLRPNWAEAYFKLGVAHSSIPITDKNRPAHTKAAIEAFQAALRLKPAWAEAHNELGAKFLELAEYKDAVRSFKEAIRLKPEFAEAHTKLAIVYLYQARYTEGIESLKEAIRIKPDLAFAHKLIGLAYLALDGERRHCSNTTFSSRSIWKWQISFCVPFSDRRNFPSE